MKTILIIAGGIAEPFVTSKTPLMEASIPALRVLGGSAETGTYYPVSQSLTLNEQSALLSLLGYNPEKGVPGRALLEKIGRGEILLNEAGLQGIVLPGFSGNGSLITPLDWAKGVGKLAMLDTPSFVYSPDDWASASEKIVSMTIDRISRQEFVAVYIDWATQISLTGDIEAKIDVLNLIDYNIINPLADFVWRTDRVMQLAVTSGYAVSTPDRRIENDRVPALIYVNDMDPTSADIEDTEEDEFNEVDCMSGLLDLPTPYSLIERLIYNN